MIADTLRITAPALQTVVRICRLHLPQEACGYIVADKDDPALGVRVVRMENVAEKPGHQFRMRDEDVVAQFAEFDALSEEPLAVFHSHPVTPPVMSEDDIAGALDPKLAHVVVSLAGPVAKARAYRVQRFVGNAIATEVAIEAQTVAQVSLPPGPWALAVGNRVRITYQRQNKNAIADVVANVLDVSDDTVYLDPDRKTSARMIPMTRIRAVHVLHEGTTGAAMRVNLRTAAGRFRAAVSSDQVESLPVLAEQIQRAFPVGIRVSVEGGR